MARHSRLAAREPELRDLAEAMGELLDACGGRSCMARAFRDPCGRTYVAGNLYGPSHSHDGDRPVVEFREEMP